MIEGLVEFVVPHIGGLESRMTFHLFIDLQERILQGNSMLINEQENGI